MAKLKNHLDHFSFLYTEGGVSKLFDHIKENMMFDMLHGTNTASWLQKHEFQDSPDNFEHGVRYRAAATTEISNALDIVSELIDTSDAGYYDFGCGKGKTLCMVGLRADFNEIVGIDYYQPFLEQADFNLKTCGLGNIELHFNDMTKFTDFKDTAVVFMYNPADETVINQVRQNLEENTNKALVIYNKPLHSEVFKDWDLVSKKDSSDPDHCTHIYSHESNLDVKRQAICSDIYDPEEWKFG